MKMETIVKQEDNLCVVDDERTNEINEPLEPEEGQAEEELIEGEGGTVVELEDIVDDVDQTDKEANESIEVEEEQAISGPSAQFRASTIEEEYRRVEEQILFTEGNIEAEDKSAKADRDLTKRTSDIKGHESLIVDKRSQFDMNEVHLEQRKEVFNLTRQPRVDIVKLKNICEELSYVDELEETPNIFEGILRCQVRLGR